MRLRLIKEEILKPLVAVDPQDVNAYLPNPKIGPFIWLEEMIARDVPKEAEIAVIKLIYCYYNVTRIVCLCGSI